MTRQQWLDSQRALRHLLKDIPRDSRGYVSSQLVQYKFGACYTSRRRMWLIYNGVSDNVIATIRQADDRLTIRYRPNSIYANIFKSRIKEWENFSVRRVPSSNLRRHRTYARENLRPIVRRAIESFKIASEPVRHPGGRLVNSYLVDYLAESASSRLRRDAHLIPVSISLGDVAIEQWRREASLGIDLDSAFANALRFLDEHDVPQEHRNWTQVFNPHSPFFADAESRLALVDSQANAPTQSPVFADTATRLDYTAEVSELLQAQHVPRSLDYVELAINEPEDV